MRIRTSPSASRQTIVLALAGLALIGCVPDDRGITLTQSQKARVRDAIMKSPPKPEHPIGATFGGAVELIGVDIEPDRPAPGQRLVVTWYWRSLAPVEDDYMVFVHLDSTVAPRRFNMDHHPVQGLHPVMAFEPGELVEDVQRVTLPRDYPVGEAKLWVGLFLRDERMPVTGKVRTDGHHRVEAATIHVAPTAPEARHPKRRGKAPVTLKVWKAPSKVEIDGVLDEPAWRFASWTRVFQDPLRGGKARTGTTRAAMLWTDRELIVAWDCEDQDIWTNLQEDDRDLWTQEVVELFLDPDGDGKTYVELQVNPANALFDAYFVTHRSDLEVARRWSSRARHGVKVYGTIDDRQDRDERWTVELAIPFDALPGVPNVPPKPGDRWRANMFRLDSDGKVGAAWSPPRVGDFHYLAAFGELEFMAGPTRHHSKQGHEEAGGAAPPAATR